MKFKLHSLIFAASFSSIATFSWGYQVTEGPVPAEAQILYEELKDRAKDCLVRAQSPEESHICRTQMLTEKAEVDRQFGLLAPVGKPVPQAKARVRSAGVHKPVANARAVIPKAGVKSAAKAGNRSPTKVVGPASKKSGAKPSASRPASRRR